MELVFEKLQTKDMEKLNPFFAGRPNKTCDSVSFDSFLWRDVYHIRYAVSGDDAIQWLMEEDGVLFGAMPTCTRERLSDCFEELRDYFNRVLGKPLLIYAADEDAVKYLRLDESGEYEVERQENSRDYLYRAEDLINLPGKKLHKKKNHIHFFEREYAGRYEYRPLRCEDVDEIWRFLDRWRGLKGDNAEAHLDLEVAGIHDILRSFAAMPARIAGVFIDGQLEAFTIGSYNELERMAVIHIEKANPQIRGLYQFINRQFLIEGFPGAVLVNREDDMGQEGLRQAKLSYAPCGYAEKYIVRQKALR